MTDLWPQGAPTRIDLAQEREFVLGQMRVRPSERSVELDGERRELQPRVMQVLVALAKGRPGVVSRDKLVELCWEGRVVGDDALNRCILALRHLAQEFSPPPFIIETVPRIGHRLVEKSASGQAVPTDAAPQRKSLAWQVFAALLALLVVAAGLLAWRQQARTEEPVSIAVLPFRNLAPGEAYFAEGVSEEIMGQLAREPAFRVAGSASSAQFAGPSDPRQVGKALAVDYILEGSVRPAGDRVRINAALIRAKDGHRLWSSSYDRRLDDMLAIQSAIGQAVASGLKRSLIHSPGPRPLNGEAYALYLNARGLIRTNNPESARDALLLLRRAIRLDPGFAPAWASLAQALDLEGRTRGNEGLIAVVPQARAAAGRALKLDPQLAQAHGVFASLVDSDTPAGISHRRRAAELAARSGEGQIWKGGAHEASGEWAEGLAAYRRAQELDPLWPIPVRAILDLSAILGDRVAAEAVIAKEFGDDPALQNFAMARVAWFSGDYSEAARRWSQAANGQSQWASPSKLSLENALYMLKLSQSPPSRPKRPSLGQSRTTPAGVWMQSPPTAAEWLRRNQSSAAELVYRDENVFAAKLMLNAGRARELAATFDSPTGLLGIRTGERIGTCFLQNAAIVALALRGVGRNAEADTILRSADSAIQAAYRRGRVPLWFEEDAAGIWAVQGRTGQAVAALDRAIRRGSAHATRTDLANLEDEPAFRGMRTDPRFLAVLAKYKAHFARERAEAARALKIAA